MLLRDIPIQKKLTFVIVLTSTVVVLLASSAFVICEWIAFRQSLVRDITMMARVVGANSSAALVFDGAEDAEQILSALRAARSIEQAAIYDGEGNLFARYPRQADLPGILIEKTGWHRFERNHLIVVRPIALEGRHIGTIYLQGNLSALTERYRLYGLIVGAILVGAFLLAVLLSKMLQRSISLPILHLADTARLVSSQKDYSVRAVKYGADELGVLTEAFNHMLAEIHERDAALRTSGQRLQLALKASQTGTWEWNPASGRLDWDDFAHPLFGLKAGEFPGTYDAFLALLEDEDEKKRVGKAMRECIEWDRELGVEFRVIWPDGSVHYLAARGKAFRDDESARVTGVYIDITEKKESEERLEAEVERRTQELQASNKELEAFTYSVSHDLRAPLRHMVAFTTILEEDFIAQLPEEARDHVARILQSARNMSRLVDDLLNLGRVGRKELMRQAADLDAILNEVLAELKPETEHRHIEWRIQQLPPLECDPGLVKQVFANLLSNAVKYTRPRKKTVIEIGSCEGMDAPTIFVRDNGVGFDMVYADKLFGVFQRLHRPEEFEGTGVGLAIVERIVHKHGGKVWAQAAVDQGATFFFTLSGERDTTTFRRLVRKKPR